MANTGNTQQIIDYGAAPNDGTGDPLRTAFIKTDENFSNIWLAGPVGSNLSIVNNTIQNDATNGNIVLRPNGVGVIQANASILPNSANLRDLGTAAQRWRAGYFGYGGLNVDGNVSITGNLSAGNISYTGNVFVGDLQGSVYADDSTIMVDAVDNAMFADSVTFGNVLVTESWSANSVGNVWNIFGDFFTFPSGASWRSDAQSLDEYITSAVDGYINITTIDSSNNEASEIQIEHGVIDINFYNGANVTWRFDDSGNFTLPGNTFAINYANGTQVLLGGDYANANVLALGEAGWAGNIIPSANAVYSLGNSTMYWSNLWVANNTIFIGGVPLGVTGNVLTVNGEAVLSNDSDSSITTTGNITANSFIGDGSQLTGIAAGTGNITFTDTTVSPPDGVDITISAANSEVIIEAFDIRLDATDDLRLTGSDLVSLRNRSTTDPVTIITDYDDTETTWTFAVDGTLTTPGDIVVAGDVTGTAGASTLVLKAQPASNTAIQLNNSVDSVISTVANLEIRTDVSNTAKTWEFDTTGNFTAPGNITANYFLGNGSQLTGLATVATTGDYDDLSNSPAIPSLGNFTLAFNTIQTGNGVGGITLRINGPDQAVPDPAFITQEWQFANTGAFTSPGNITTTGNISAGNIDTGNISATRLQNDGNLEIRTDVSNTARTFEFGADGRLILPESSEANVAKFTSPPNDANVSLQLYSGNAVRIVSNTVGEPFVWTFGTTGTFTAAGNISAGNIDTGIITLTNGAQIRDTAGAAVAFGVDAGANTQGNSAVAIGDQAGQTSQGANAVAIGTTAGQTSQGNRAVAIGLEAGTNSQGVGGVAIGEQAGHISQGVLSVAIGYYAGANTQSFSAVAIGAQAGETAQGSGAIAIGDLAGRTNQANNSIILNATGANLDQTTANTFTVAPVRNDVANVANVMFYNATSKEITYGNTISVAGNISATRLQNDGNLEIRSNVAGTLKNWTFDTLGDLNLPAGGNISGSGGISANNITLTGNISANTAGFAIGYRDIPQVSFTGNATMAAADAGKHFYSTESTDYILTIANNASQGFAVGAAITIVNQGTGNITVAQGSGVTLYLAGNASSGNRNVTTFGMATVMKVATDTWFINGTGVV